ncbi:hypothetical protein D9M68_934080 [compost metagenome]
MRAMVGVLPSTSAASTMARLMALFRLAAVRCAPVRARLAAAAIVPRSVRKSLAVKSEPVRSLT